MTSDVDPDTRTSRGLMLNVTLLQLMCVFQAGALHPDEESVCGIDVPQMHCGKPVVYEN